MSRHVAPVLLLTLILSIPASAATVRVKGNRTPLRANPAVTAEILDHLPQGRLLELVDVVRDWYRVRDPETKQDGYVLASLVELLPGDSKESAARPLSGQVAAGRKAPAARRVPPAPKPGEWRDAGFVFADGLFQAKGETFSYSFSPAQYAYAEKASLTARYPVKEGVAFDAGAGIRVWRNLAVGAVVSVFSKSSTVEVTGTVPHPLYLNRDRAVTGAFSSNRTETAVHFQATWVAPLGRRTFLSLAGGPSCFRLTQAIADGINLSTIYPYDTTSVTGAQTSDVSKWAIGGNVSADLSWYVTRAIGVGALVRYSRGSADLATSATGVSSTVGGLQAGVGLRLRLSPADRRPRLPVRAPAPPPPPPVKK